MTVSQTIELDEATSAAVVAWLDARAAESDADRAVRVARAEYEHAVAARSDREGELYRLITHGPVSDGAAETSIPVPGGALVAEGGRVRYLRHHAARLTVVGG